LEPTRPPQTRAFQTATPFYHPLTDFNFLFLWAPLNHESLVEQGENPYIEIQGKGRKPRRAYLREDVIAMLHAYFDAKTRAELPLSGAMFVSLRTPTRGGRLTRDAIAAATEKRLEIAGLRAQGVRCHALRHTFGTLAVQGGASIEHVRDAMGHSNLATTSIYIRAHDRMQNNPAKFIEIS